MQRAQAYLPFVLHSLRHDLRPSTFPILPSTSPRPRFRRNIYVHLVFWIRELAHIFKFKCCTEQRRFERYYGPRYSSQWFCCHNCWGMSHFCQVLLQTLRSIDADLLEPIGGMEQWGVPFTIRCEWVPASLSMGRNLRELVGKLRRGRRFRHCAGLRGCVPNPTTGGGMEDCCSRCAQEVHSFVYMGLIPA
jgi:hypothetical protein